MTFLLCVNYSSYGLEIPQGENCQLHAWSAISTFLLVISVNGKLIDTAVCRRLQRCY